MVSPVHFDELPNVRALRLPAIPRVVDIKYAPYIDSEGADALRVWVILDNKTKPSQRRWKHLEPIEEVIREALRNVQGNLWPYFKYRTRSEFRAERKKA
jgi:isoleucyl-tRNA synthetase